MLFAGSEISLMYHAAQGNDKFLHTLFIALREVLPSFFVKILFIGGMGRRRIFGLRFSGRKAE